MITNGMIKNSIWLEVPGYPNYRVSPEGNVLSLRFSKFPRVLRPGKRKNGYLGVFLDSKKNMLVHRLVAMVYCERKPECDQVNHKNGNPEDNRAENLEWVTAKENCSHRQSVLKRQCGRPGSRHPKAKLKEYQVREIKKLLAAGVHPNELGRRFGVSSWSIREILAGRNWKHIQI